MAAAWFLTAIEEAVKAHQSCPGPEEGRVVKVKERPNSVIDAFGAIGAS
jgi:hypothetical protein